MLQCRCSDIKSQTRLQLARLLFEQGRQLEGSPMLFELATALPDLLATASRAVVEQLRLSPCLGLSQPQGADSEHISVPDSRIEQQARRGQMRQQQQHQMVDVVVESAMLQVRLVAFDRPSRLSYSETSTAARLLIMSRIHQTGHMCAIATLCSI